MGVQLSDLPAEVADVPAEALTAHTAVAEKPTVHCTDAGSEPAGEEIARFTVWLPEEVPAEDRVNACP